MPNLTDKIDESTTEFKNTSIRPLINELVSLISCEQLDLKENINTLFAEEHHSITPYLVNPSIFCNGIDVPHYDSAKNYTKVCKTLKDSMSSVIEQIKTESLEISWLQEQITFHTPDIEFIEEIEDSQTQKIKKKRRSLESLSSIKTVVCPYEGCEKTYTVKTSLRMHINKHHQKDEALKPGIEHPNMKNNFSRKFVDVYKVFKNDYAKKIEKRAENSTRASFEFMNSEIGEEAQGLKFLSMSSDDFSRKVPAKKVKGASNDFVSEFLQDLKDPDRSELSDTPDEFLNFSEVLYGQGAYSILSNISSFELGFMPEGIDFGLTDENSLFKKNSSIEEDFGTIVQAEIGNSPNLIRKKDFCPVFDYMDRFVGLTD